MKEFNGYELSQKEIESILGISKPQAWRIYTGKCKLTNPNKRAINLYFESLDINTNFRKRSRKSGVSQSARYLKRRLILIHTYHGGTQYLKSSLNALFTRLQRIATLITLTTLT